MFRHATGHYRAHLNVYFTKSPSDGAVKRSGRARWRVATAGTLALASLMSLVDTNDTNEEAYDEKRRQKQGSRLIKREAEFNLGLLHQKFTEMPKVNCEASSLSDEATFTPEEVSNHDGSNGSIWVTYKHNVYDVTKFVEDHPGGIENISMAAGGPIDSYWAYWAAHLYHSKPTQILEKYRVGKLILPHDGEDKEEEDLEKEMYSLDPNRIESVNAGQKMLTHRPWQSETIDSKLEESFFTPNEAFYVRNHAPVPVVDEDHFVLAMEFDGRGTTMSLDNLKDKYDITVIHSVLQCAGNRAGDMIKIAPTAFSGGPDVNLGNGMIGNASWKGVRLRDVLLDAFPHLKDIITKENSFDSYHVEFMGGDGYATSCPLSRIIDETADALLAFEMNGVPLPPDHGYPLRVILPGIAGSRNVKWLSGIRIRRGESDTCFQQKFYKDVHGRSIQEMPMQAFMTSKKERQVDSTELQNSKEGKGALRHKKVIEVKGVAWGGANGSGISRVELSCDDGRTWKEANLRGAGENVDDSSRHWAWVQFDATIDYGMWDEKKQDEVDKVPQGEALLPMVVSRAYDGNGLRQPEKVWYPGGYLSNGWHRL